MTLIAPTLLLAFYIVALVTLVCLRQPLKPWLPFVGMSGLLTAGILLLWKSSQHTRKVFVMSVVLALATSWGVLALRVNTLVPIPAMSAHMDSWCYSAVAEYLTDYPRGTVGGLGVTDQWSSHLSNTRFPSPCILALTRLLGDPIDAQSWALWFMLIANFGAIAAFMRVCGLQLPLALAATAFALISGWHGTAAITLGNFDNLIFIAEACGGITTLLAWTRGMLSDRIFVGIFSLLVGSMIMTYPEGTALLGILSSPWAIYLIATLWCKPRRLTLIMAGIGLGLLLSASYLPVLMHHLSTQLSYSSNVMPGSRPGDHNVDGLLTTRFLGAAFTSGEEYPNAPFSFWGSIWGFFLLGLFIDGVRRLRHSLPWYPWIGLSFLTLLLWQGYFSRYEYGVYKVLFCACWWIFTAVAVSVSSLFGTRKGPWMFMLGMAAAVLLQYSTRNYRVWQQTTQVSDLKELTALRPWLNHRSVVITLDNDFKQMWATLMLRGLPLSVAKPTGSLDMPHVRALVAGTAPLPVDRPTVYLDEPGLPGEILKSSHFAIYDGRRAFIKSIDNPNGIERVNNQQFMWVANHAPTILRLKVPKSGLYKLTSAQVVFGPSATPGVDRELEITDSAGVRTEKISTTLSLSLHLDAGDVEVSLRCINHPEVFTQPNGDTRELLVGIFSLRVESPEN